MEPSKNNATVRPPWNKGKLVGQKAPFKLKGKGQSRPTGAYRAKSRQSSLHFVLAARYCHWN
jgi:hypothetical protein